MRSVTTGAKLSSGNLVERDQNSGSKRTKALPERQSFQLEPLENRLLLSVTLSGIPDWVNQGPTSEVQA